MNYVKFLESLKKEMEDDGVEIGNPEAENKWIKKKICETLNI